jgi:hypothetical protein
LGDHAVEAGTLVAKAVLTSAQLAEVARGLGHNIVVKLEDDAPCVFSVDSDIELRFCFIYQQLASSKSL